jgi:CubicO group peptidase (beta-lactamase class C family)
VTPETLFAIGSSTKAFTATLVGILVDDGLLDFDEPVRTYLPDFELADDYATEHLTPRDLLTHVSGLPRHDLLWYGSDLTRDALFARLRHLEPSVSFRQTWQYQNLMYMTAGLLAGRVAGSTWEELVRTRIFEPLSIGYANFSVRDMEEVEDAARGYTDGEDGLERMDYRDIDAIGPAGSINANVVEMGNWLRLHLGKGEFLGERVVSKDTMAQLHAPHAMVARGKKDRHTPYSMYAMGWMVEPYRGHDLLHHGGNIDGFSALMTFLPDDDLGVVVLTNKNGTPITNVLTYELIDRMLGLSPLNHDQRAGGGRAAALAASQGAEAAETGRVKDTKPAHALADYAGEYEHAAYGVASFALDGEALSIDLGPFAGELEHWHFETFRFGGSELGRGVDFTFETDPAGDVVAMSVKLEPSVAPVRFARLPSGRLSDPAFLARLAGEYELSGQTCTVDVVGGTPRVTVPGQPTYTLEPHRDTSFRLKELSGYVLEFELQGEDVVAAVFHQPNGVFRAARRASARVAD